MASYTAPDQAFFARVSGLEAAIEGIGDGDFDAVLADCLEDAEDEFALMVTESVFDSSELTERQARGVRKGVAYLVLAHYLFRPQGQKATGTNEPLTMDGTEISLLRLDYVNRATRMALLVTGRADQVLRGLAA